MGDYDRRTRSFTPAGAACFAVAILACLGLAAWEVKWWWIAPLLVVAALLGLLAAVPIDPGMVAP